eukprot:Plantae.Rhodophyta-Hildenbrandia_rubra.ctg4894.p3 GENE.Plantae.Rhodophyta-Hildenbrandia_rubra.ctg4894~~Plantae.Rhodophyta-Hildenbrandia_rubra.ctg4894.p3  ORF type:complete len:170 (-),score=24.66 Plantae.Rhodophyta-Hildenbrandia_rubra.ctg4894:2459-2968(-)
MTVGTLIIIGSSLGLLVGIINLATAVKARKISAENAKNKSKEQSASAFQYAIAYHAGSSGAIDYLSHQMHSQHSGDGPCALPLEFPGHNPLQQPLRLNAPQVFSTDSDLASSFQHIPLNTPVLPPIGAQQQPTENENRNKGGSNQVVRAFARVMRAKNDLQKKLVEVTV